MTLNDKLATIQTKFKSKKSRYNSFGKYYFRSAEDILEATKPFLLELGVFLIDDTQDADAANTHGKATAKKPKLVANSDEFKKALAYVEGGGTVAKIKLKYDISADVEKLLTK